MRWITATGLAAALAGAGAASTASPVVAQAIVGLEKRPKPAAGSSREALERLRAPWGGAHPLDRPCASFEADMAVLRHRVREPLKLLLIDRSGSDRRLALKSQMLLAEERLEVAVAAASRGELDGAAARAEVERVLGEYASTIEAHLEDEVSPAVGVGRTRRTSSGRLR
ncbi:MAG TPA: hypothetical protein VLA09_09970 [Longimicrobiales bacterium]|nr:hypothetical protein [Longimicrobiales bacterium]